MTGRPIGLRTAAGSLRRLSAQPANGSRDRRGKRGLLRAVIPDATLLPDDLLLRPGCA